MSSSKPPTTPFNLDAYLGQAPPKSDDGAAAYLAVLQSALRRDHLGRGNWAATLLELTHLVRDAVKASQALVALWSGTEQRWQALSADNHWLDELAMGEIASLSVLDKVRVEGKAFLSTAEAALPITSESIQRQGLAGFLVVPLYFWEPTDDGVQRGFAGCLYAQRTARQLPFTPRDAELVEDLALLSQPVLNVLRNLDDIEGDLARAQAEVQRLRGREAAVYKLGGFSTRDPHMAEHILAPLERLGQVRRVNLLIEGPTGSGKSHLAEAFHRNSVRKAGPFVVLDCAQVTSMETLSAELFGYAADSGYANAPKQGRPGKAELAHDGTLFIDEVGLLPAALQQALLRLVEKNVFSRLGSSQERTVDIQVVAATNESLHALVRGGRFREDLYWRLNDFYLRLPSLSERPLDIPDLAEGFLRASGERLGRKLTGFTTAAMRVLVNHDWARAGNVRGLERTVQRAALLTPPRARRVDLKDLQLHPTLADPVATDAGSKPVRPRAESAELTRIKEAIREHGFASKAAKALGLSYRELTWQLHKVGSSVREVLASDD